MDDTHVSHLVATGAGEEINNPFQGSVLHGLAYEKRENIEDYEPGVRLDELCVEDKAELSSIAGMDFIFDDGDYLGDFEE